MDAALPGIPVSSTGAPTPPPVPDFKLPADPLLNSLTAGAAAVEAVVLARVAAQVYRVELRGRIIELGIPAELAEGDRLELRRDPRGDFAVRILPPSRPPVVPPTLPEPAPGGGALTPPEQIASFLQREGLQGDPRAASVAEALVRFRAPLDGETVRRLIDLVTREPVARRPATLDAGAFLASRLLIPSPSLARSLAALAVAGDGPSAVLERLAAGTPVLPSPSPSGMALGVASVPPAIPDNLPPAGAAPETVPGTPPARAPVEIRITPPPPPGIGAGFDPAHHEPERRRPGRLERTAGIRTSVAGPAPSRIVPLVPGAVPVVVPPGVPTPPPVPTPTDPGAAARFEPALPPSPAEPPVRIHPAGPPGAESSPIVRTLTAFREFAATLLDGVESGASAHRLREDAVAFLDRRSAELPPFLARDLRRELDAWVSRPLTAPRLLNPLRDFVRTLRDRGALADAGSETAVEIDRLLDRLFVEGGRIFRRGPAGPDAVVADPAVPTAPATSAPEVAVNPFPASPPPQASTADLTVASRSPADRTTGASALSSSSVPGGLPAPDPAVPGIPHLREVMDALVLPLTTRADPSPLRSVVERLLGSAPLQEIPALTAAVSRALDSSSALRLLDRLIGEIDRLLAAPPVSESLALKGAGGSPSGSAPHAPSARPDPVEAILARVRTLLSGGSAEGAAAPADAAGRLDALSRDELSILKARLTSLERETIRAGPPLLPFPEAAGLRELADRAGAFRVANQASLLHREGIVIFDLPVAVDGRVQSVPVRLIRRDAGEGSGGRRGGGSGAADVRIDVSLTGLGRVTTRLHLEGKRVRVDFRVRNEAVRDLLRAGEPELTASLRARGLDPAFAVGLRAAEDESDPVPLEAFLAGHGAVDLTA